jgi:hypothetical protein
MSPPQNIAIREHIFPFVIPALGAGLLTPPPVRPQVSMNPPQSIPPREHIFPFLIPQFWLIS